MSEIDDIIAKISPYYAKRKKKKDKGADMIVPSSEHKLVYNSLAETLEPVYFWILDFMNNMFGGNVEKLIDNFSSSPGSGHFSEIGLKKAEMQKQAMNAMQMVNTILRSTMNILYDLKEFQIRLSHYDNAKSEDKNKKQAGLLSLKQIWMDKVDIQRGPGSINMMTTGNLQFVTLRDAFMITNSIKNVDELDLNDLVKRVLKPRVQEFLEWKKRSEEQLRKQFEIEKTYLKSQVDSLKLYARWAKPYLKSAQQLEEHAELSTKPELVNIFNIVLFNLTIMGKKEVNVEQEIIDKNLPRDFKKIKGLRKYYSIVFVDFNFRGVPSKAGQHYTFGGKSEVFFRAYSLNEDELILLKEKLSESDLDDSLKLIQGMTDDSLQQLKLDIEEFLGDAKEKEKKSEEDISPFGALFSFVKRGEKLVPEEKSKKQEEQKLNQLKQKGVKSDKYVEKYIRNLTEANAINNCYDVFDIYKKAHGMAAFPYREAAEAKPPRTSAEEVFGFGKTKG